MLKLWIYVATQNKETDIMNKDAWLLFLFSGEQSIISGLQFYRCNESKIFLSISVNSIAADLITFCFQEDVNMFSFVNIIWEDKVKQEDNAGASLACRWEDLKKEFKPTKRWDVEHVTIMGQSNTILSLLCPDTRL